MSKEENFKKKLQDLVDSKEFAFHENYWDEARAVIDSERSKNKRRIVFYLISAGILLSGLTGLFLLKPSEKSFTQYVSSADQSVSKHSEIVKPVTHNSEINKKKSSPKKNYQSASLQKSSNAVISKQTENEASNQNAQTSEFTNRTKQIQKEEKSKNPDEQSNTTNAGSGVQHTGIIEPTNLIQQETVLVQPVLNLPKKDSITEPEVSTSFSQTMVQSDAMLAVTSKVQTESILPATETIRKTDSSQSAAEPIPVVLPESLKNMIVSVEAGFNYLYGWKGAMGTEARGFNPVFGLNYHKSLFHFYGYSIGLHFTSVGHLKNFSDTSKVTRYKFGEESDVTVISPRTFYYLDIPLYLNWKFSTHQSIGAGLNFSYLLNVNSKVETYQESISISGNKSQMERGYTEGVSKQNLQFGFYYRRQLFKNLYLQPALLIGLKDLKDNAFFNSDTKERSSGIKITLLYSLMNE